MAALLLSAFAMAQPGALTSKAIQRVQAGDLMAARSAIIEAIQSPKERNAPYTWYVKGYVFKEIYKEIDKGNPQSENREIAVEAILKSIELGQATAGNAELETNTEKALRYLAVSYYNDAVLMARSLTPETIDAPVQRYERYKQLLMALEPQHDFTDQDVEFYKNMARGAKQIYDANPAVNGLYFERSNQFYRQAIALAADDFQANYNLAVNYYNHGVHKIRKIDHNTEIFELIRIQDECVALFKQALPYMRKANELKPDHRSTLSGLMAIHRSLSEDDAAALFQTRLEAIIKKGTGGE